MKVVLAPMLSMCPNVKHLYKKLIPVHPESIASSAFKRKKIYDRRMRSSAMKTWHSWQPHLHEADWLFSDWRCKPVRDAATTLSMYRWNFSQYVECNSTSSSFLSTDASRHDAVAVLECKPSDALHVSGRSDIPATLLLTSRSATPDTRH